MNDNQKTVMLTIISACTLLITIAGASFAYFSVTQQNTNKTSIVTATTKGAPGVISASGGEVQLYINLDDNDMKKDKQGTTYYATNEQLLSGVTVNPGYTSLGTLGITGGSDTSIYGCTWDFTVSMSAKTSNGAIDTNKSGAIEENEMIAIPASSFKSADGNISFNNDSNIQLSATSFTLSELMNESKNITGKFIQTGNGSNNYKVLSTFVNTNVEQNALSNMYATITFGSAKNLSCDIYSSEAEAKSAIGME